MPYSKFTVKQDDDESTVITATTNSQPTASLDSTTNEITNIMRAASTSSVTLSNTSFCASISGLPSLAPYINRSSLKYLDSKSLEQNMQVRHDLVLESTFRLTSQHMAEATDEYWSSIRLELAELALPDVQMCPRLAALIAEIRELMLDLYPRCELVTGQLNEALDENLIIQQLKHGLFDVAGLFGFLASVMKKNCAPKRDAAVDLMLENAHGGNVIEALQLCLELMEAMKLDLANYKLDQIRPHVAQTAVIVERKFFELMFSSSKLNLDMTKKWLKDAATETGLNGHECFAEALVRLLVCPFVRETSVPETFILDKKRLISLHSAFQDLCIVQCLMLIYKQNCGNAPRSLAGERLKSDLLDLLNRPDTQISDIVQVMSQAVADFRGQLQVQAADFNTIHAAINKIIAPENELFLMVEKKLLSAVRAHLLGHSKTSSGLSDLNVLDKLGEIAEKLSKITQFNWAVFGPLYTTLFKMIQAEV